MRDLGHIIFIEFFCIKDKYKKIIGQQKHIKLIFESENWCVRTE